jgi:Na+/H+-dicarboxylate symporter
MILHFITVASPYLGSHLFLLKKFLPQVAIDWFLDRCITALNITGDTVVCCIISQNIDLSDMDGLVEDDKKETKHGDQSLEDSPSEEDSQANA